MPKLIYFIGRGLQVVGMIFTSISLLLFGKIGVGGAMAPPMIAAAIGGFWFFIGWLCVRTAMKG